MSKDITAEQAQRIFSDLVEDGKLEQYGREAYEAKRKIIPDCIKVWESLTDEQKCLIYVLFAAHFNADFGPACLPLVTKLDGPGMRGFVE